MSSWYNVITKIETLIKHPNADTLDLITVLGDFPVVAKSGQYKIGDLCCYISVDTIAPDNEDFYFLCPLNKEKYEEDGEVKERITGPKYPVGSVPEKYRRIRSKKIRDIYSQGMLFPLQDNLKGLKEGDDVTEILGLKKYEEEEEENIPGSKVRSGDQEKAPEGWKIPYYDIEGIRKYIKCLQDNEEIVLTEKVHGSNYSVVYDGEKVWCKSRNRYLKRDEDCDWWEVTMRLGLEEKLKAYPNLVFFGELTGKVKGFRYGCQIVNGKLETTVYFFDIYNTKTNRYLSYDEFVSIIDELKLNKAPLLYRGPWIGKEKMYPYAEGITTLNDKHIREGFVLRTAIERFEPKLNSRMIVKLIGEGYSLNKK